MKEGRKADDPAGLGTTEGSSKCKYLMESIFTQSNLHKLDPHMPRPKVREKAKQRETFS